MIGFIHLLLVLALSAAAHGDPPSWSEVVEVAAAYLAEIGGVPLRVDPNPGEREFKGVMPNALELEQRRRTIQAMGLSEISYEWVTGCYASFTLPPPKEPPYVKPECLSVPVHGSVVIFDDPVHIGTGWRVMAVLVNRDVIMEAQLYLEKKEGSWNLVRKEHRVVFNY